MFCKYKDDNKCADGIEWKTVLGYVIFLILKPLLQIFLCPVLFYSRDNNTEYVCLHAKSIAYTQLRQITMCVCVCVCVCVCERERES